MKFLESRTVARVIENKAETEYRVVCHGSATYRVWMGNTPVNRPFASFDAAADYAIRAAHMDAHVLIGRATVV